MELFRLSIVYLHLIACCVAIGLVLTSDIAMVNQLIKGDTAEKQEAAHLNSLKKTVSLALVALWITGFAIVWLDVSAKGFTYFANPKMQAKLTIVALLTLNGFVLHSAVMPAMEKAGSLLQMAFNQRMLAIFAGAVSAVSWFYAAMLGVGRPLAWKYSLVQLLAAYPALIVAGFAAMVTLTVWSRYRSELDFTQFAEAHSAEMK
ncbi:hypothetical protein [Collimonas silvisoli]|uniref:hypothetical protein n=1 Tax=Collimonas silvisoli TaxID=2825884 RepID=UPI001B8D5766|nr:hypothetical protein [Collimonas silvisoli]